MYYIAVKYLNQPLYHVMSEEPIPYIYPEDEDLKIEFYKNTMASKLFIQKFSEVLTKSMENAFLKAAADFKDILPSILDMIEVEARKNLKEPFIHATVLEAEPLDDDVWVFKIRLEVK